MKFHLAWARIAAQNVTLKVATAVLAVVALAQLVVILGLAGRAPLVIERACYSRVVSAKPEDPTREDVKAFLMEALPMRFDTEAYMKNGFLSLDEAGAREKEQAQLKEHGIFERLLVESVSFEGKVITASCDRLLAVGKIKSALPLGLEVEVEQTNRTESNPYGLILSKVREIDSKETK